MKNLITIPGERIENKIYLIRGKKVMFDKDFAELYGVPTRRLNEQVKRNKKRFPEDFMFRLNKQETAVWSSRSQIATLKQGGNTKYAPSVFTEQGVAMLSSVLNSDQAIQVNIQIMRTFTKIREMLVSNKELREKVESLERKYDKHFKAVFEAIKQLIRKDDEPVGKIGYRI